VRHSRPRGLALPHGALSFDNWWRRRLRPDHRLARNCRALVILVAAKRWGEPPPVDDGLALGTCSVIAATSTSPPLPVRRRSTCTGTRADPRFLSVASQHLASWSSRDRGPVVLLLWGLFSLLRLAIDIAGRLAAPVALRSTALGVTACRGAAVANARASRHLRRRQAGDADLRRQADLLISAFTGSARAALPPSRPSTRPRGAARRRRHADVSRVLRATVSTIRSRERLTPARERWQSDRSAASGSSPPS